MYKSQFKKLYRSVISQMNDEIMRQVGFGDKVDLKNNGQCPNCKAKVNSNSFRDDVSRREFKISGLCQKCQDEIFGTDTSADTDEEYQSTPFSDEEPKEISMTDDVDAVTEIDESDFPEDLREYLYNSAEQPEDFRDDDFKSNQINEFKDDYDYDQNQPQYNDTLSAAQYDIDEFEDPYEIENQPLITEDDGEDNDKGYNEGEGEYEDYDPEVEVETELLSQYPNYTEDNIDDADIDIDDIDDDEQKNMDPDDTFIDDEDEYHFNQEEDDDRRGEDEDTSFWNYLRDSDDADDDYNGFQQDSDSDYLTEGSNLEDIEDTDNQIENDLAFESKSKRRKSKRSKK